MLFKNIYKYSTDFYLRSLSMPRIFVFKFLYFFKLQTAFCYNPSKNMIQPSCRNLFKAPLRPLLSPTKMSRESSFNTPPTHPLKHLEKIRWVSILRSLSIARILICEFIYFFSDYNWSPLQYLKKASLKFP